MRRLPHHSRINFIASEEAPRLSAGAVEFKSRWAVEINQLDAPFWRIYVNSAAPLPNNKQLL